MNLYEISIDPKQKSLFNEDEPGSLVMPEDIELFSLSGEAEEVGEKPEGKRFDRSIVEEVWEASEKINGNDAAMWRKDANGLTICRSEYGNRYSSFGWEIVEAGAGPHSLAGTGLKAVHVDSL